MPHATIWVTDHFISQRVGAALKMGLGQDATLALATQASPAQIAATPLHIGYGILRGMDKVARLAEAQGKDWFLLDLGYTNPGHFSGNYRIGYKGTQTLFDARHLAPDVPASLAPWKEDGAYALICPPTAYVAAYYGIADKDWCGEAAALACSLRLDAKFRRKGDAENLDAALISAACVITFNSSVAWKALAAGIPAFSDTTCSTVGSWHGACASLEAVRGRDRGALFRFRRTSLPFLKSSRAALRQSSRAMRPKRALAHVNGIPLSSPPPLFYSWPP